MKDIDSKIYLKIFVALFMLFSVANVNLAQKTVGGTIITNFAQASYKDQNGILFNTISPTVFLTVKAISSLVVTPDETEASAVVAPNQSVTRQFRVCNTSNNSDSYTLTRVNISSPAQLVGLYFDADGDGLISANDVPIALNNTRSSTIEVGSCVAVLADINTQTISVGEQLRIGITARSNVTDAANGIAEDEGTIINTAGKAAVLTDPDNPTLAPVKTVENQRSWVTSKNQPLKYQIAFRNSGDIAARNVVLTDELPDGLQYIAKTLQIDARSVSDADDSDEGSVTNNRLTVRLANPVAPGQIVHVAFQAMIVKNLSPGAGVTNVAELSASNAPKVSTNPAVAVVDPFGTVYAARGGSAARIAGARVAISTAQNGENLLSLPQNQGFDPNLANDNPYLTNSQGRFSFGLRSDQLGAQTQPVTYFVFVSAENFRPRLLQAILSPSANGLFKMIVRSLDRMPVAVADGFELTENEVEISSIADVAFNIPMFENSTIEVTKTADRAQADIGDLITYRVDVHNASIAPVYDALVKDTLPDSFSYVAGTARIERGSQTEPIEPVVTDNVMQFRLAEIASGERFSIVYRVRIGVNVREGDSYNSVSISGRFPSGETIQSAPARVAVRVGAGVFSMRQIVVGRVFVDDNGNQTFDKGEQPVAGARIYSANGQSVITDSEGMYNLPAVSEGAQVLALDPVTLPEGYLLAGSNSRAGKSWSRLLRTPLGGGSLLRQNFVLVASENNPPAARKGMDKDSEDVQKAVNVKSKEKQNADVNFSKKTDNKNVVVDAEKKEEEIFRPVAAGEVFFHSLKNNAVVMSPAANFNVSVAEKWKAEVELNNQKFGEANIGQTREDRTNKITTYTFVGLGLKPGPNHLRVTPVSPDGEAGKTVELILYGRGAAKRLEVIADRKELQASGRDSTTVLVRAFDEWGNPAQDATLMVQTSAGRLLKFEETIKNAGKADANKMVVGKDAESTAGIAAEQVNELTQQQNINLVEGIGLVKLIADNHTGVAQIKASSGSVSGQTEVRFTPEMRSAILVSSAEVTIGSAAPEMINRAVDKNVQTHVQLFYRGSLFKSKNLLTLGYDSEQPLNSIAGRDRMFQLNPLDRAYPIFGDSSTHFQETESNSKLYARVDRGRSYAMFGDFTADMDESRLAGYGRKLTGVKLHLENENNDFITVTGARPDTSFARQIIAGGSLGLVQLDYPNVMPGSEVLTIETRDRRNPELIVSREVLVRSLDYNLDSTTGTVFFLRPVSVFDRDLNLVQIVATYEYRSTGMESSVYTARASKNIKSLGLRLGFSFVSQQQAQSSPFRLGGIDASLDLPHRGKLEAEWAMSSGELNTGFSFLGGSQNANRRHDGNAFLLSVVQPLPKLQSVLRFEGWTASENFFNPFGSTVTPGTTRGAFSWEGKVLNKSTLRLNLIGELNSTENVDNNRVTAGLNWSQMVNEKVRLSFGYDFRRFSDAKADRTISSNLLTFGAEIKPTEKLEFGIKREQNIGEADPSFPNQTTFSADYRVNDWSKVFFTQRLASAAIVPIADVGQTGFAASNARTETAVGVESQFGKHTSMTGRYQLENGANGTDSFAIVGLQNRLPINKNLSFDFGFERAFHLDGNGASYNNIRIGASWLPTDSFRSSVRYELRDRGGLGQVFTLGAAGVLHPGWTVMGRYQYGNISFNERTNRITDGQAAVAIRPHDTDRYGLLFSYTHRDSYFSNGVANLPTRLRSDMLSADGFYQATKRLELYGHTAVKLSGDGNTNLPFAENLTYLLQARAQYLLSGWVDIAAEGRYLYQPSSGSRRNWYGAETGFWVLPDLRVGVGYNFSKSQEVYGFNNNSIYNRNGFYFVVSSKLSRLFNLFGTSDKGLKEEPPADEENPKNVARKKK